MLKHPFLFPVCIFIMLSGLLAPAMAELKDENLLAPLPEGFKIGSHNNKGKMVITEYVPQNETADDWTQMVTVQIFHDQANMDLDNFAGQMQKLWTTICSGGDARKIASEKENSYPVELWLFSCPENPQTKKPENMWLKAISGQDSLYAIQYAFRQELNDTMIKPAMTYLKQVTVCDTRKTDSPCPKTAP